MVDVIERDLHHLVIVQDLQEGHQDRQEDLQGPQDHLKPKRREHQVQEEEAAHQAQEVVPQVQGIDQEAQEEVTINPHQEGHLMTETQEVQTKKKEDKKEHRKNNCKVFLEEK